MEIHVVDGTYELFRAHYGAPAREVSGREVGAVTGLLASLARWLALPEVTHVACAFDHVIESFRNELFAGYKTGEGMDPLLWSQFELAEEATRALGIVTWPMVEFEADDALATAAARYQQAPGVSRVVLCSVDKDLAQCVGPKVVRWDRRERWLDEAGVLREFGVLPSSIPDYLALVGDAADGIPGVPRWGKKSAQALLAVYGHLEQIPERAADWEVKPRGAERLAESLASHRDVALLYRTLATLRCDVPLAEDVADLEWRGVDEPALRRLSEVIGSDSVLKRMTR
ncbi:MAG: flap endonuclease [Polyangiaceae bacterium]|nr:flap endonuclease [Polyangiaceae bacterium]MCW5792476.1 flap endonuclease [Polyangiaceae bacterium]